jgi:SUMO ligase MMS21 Smc5/6 complex component
MKQHADSWLPVHCNTDSPVLLCGEKVNVSPVKANRVLQKTESKCKASGLLE